MRFSRLLGRSVGGLGYEIEGADGQLFRLTFTAEDRGFLIAIAPSVLVTRRLVRNEFDESGLVTPEKHVDPDELVQYLDSANIRFAMETE